MIIFLKINFPLDTSFFILFLIPILSSFLHFQLNENKIKYSKQIILLICLISFFLTVKYHLRFNEGRKFHELQNVNLTKSLGLRL